MVTANGYKRTELVEESMKLLGKYGYDVNKYDVGTIMDEWWKAKEPIIRLFEKHPNYNGKYQIVLQLTMDREIDTDELYNFRHWFRLMIEEKFMESEDWRVNWWRVENVFTNPKKFIDEEEADRLNNTFEKFGANAGQKRSRVVNKLAKIFEVDKLAEFNANFARYADAINPVKIQRPTVISVHPIDYWTMSFGNSWASCHTIDKENIRDRGGQTYGGCYSSGTESYMLDPSSVVFYTVDSDYSGNMFELQDKINRNMFHLGEDVFVQGRVYPQGNDGALDVYKVFREIVQKVYSEITGIPNLWINKKGTDECGDVTETYGTHYRDYLSYGDCNVSYAKGNDSSTVKRIVIGHNPICPCCGRVHYNEENICCPECAHDGYECANCGSIIDDEDDVCWIDGSPYCRDCATWDEYAEEWTLDDCVDVNGYGHVSVYNVENNPDEFAQCACCGDWYYLNRHDGIYVESTGNWYCDYDCAENDGNVYASDLDEWIPEDEAVMTGDGDWYSSEEAIVEAGYTELLDDGLYYTPEDAEAIRKRGVVA